MKLVKQSLIKLASLEEATQLLRKIEERLEGIDSEDVTQTEIQIWNLLHYGRLTASLLPSPR